MNSDITHIEYEQLRGLIDAAGVDGAREILNAFWKSTDDLFEQLAEQVGASDLEMAARTAHALKGMAANVGASALSATAALLEQACKNDQGGQVPTHISDARDAYAFARDHLLDYLKEAS